jgi:hypothetical protein
VNRFAGATHPQTICQFSVAATLATCTQSTRVRYLTIGDDSYHIISLAVPHHTAER